MHPRIGPWLVGVLALVLLSCGDDGTGPEARFRPALSAAAGTGQEGAAGRALAQQLGALLVDGDGRAIAGYPVSFRVTEGGGSLSATTIRTDALGVARTSWTIGPAGTPQRAVATVVDTVTGAVLDTAVFTATSRILADRRLWRWSGDLQNGEPGTTLRWPITIQVTDTLEAPVAGATVAWRILEGGGTLGVSESVTNAQGLASVTLTLPSARADVRIRATTIGGRDTLELWGRALPPDVVTHPLGEFYGRRQIGNVNFGIGVSAGGTIVSTLINANGVRRLSLEGEILGEITPTGATAVDVAFSPDGARAYVSNRGGSFSIVDVATGALVQNVAVPWSPLNIAVSPSGDQLVVASDDSLRSWRLPSLERGPSVPLGENSEGVRYSPSGDRIYASTRTRGTLLEIDPQTMRVLATMPVGGSGSWGVAVSDSRVYVVRPSTWSVLVFSRATRTPLAPIEVGESALDIALSPDQAMLYVVHLDGYLTIRNAITGAFLGGWIVGGMPRRVAFDRRGTTAVVSNENGWIDYIR